MTNALPNCRSCARQATVREASRLVHRRQKHGHEQSDDADHNQQFDERKRSAFAPAHCRQLDERESIIFTRTM